MIEIVRKLMELEGGLPKKRGKELAKKDKAASCEGRNRKRRHQPSRLVGRGASRVHYSNTTRGGKKTQHEEEKSHENYHIFS